MMKISKKLISLALAAMLLLGLAVPVMATDRDFYIESMEYPDLSGGGEMKTGNCLLEYRGPGGDVVIPDGVAVIVMGAFANCTSLTSVTIPESVDFIDYYAFEGCTSLTSATVISGDTGICPSSFLGCTSLTDFYFGGTKDKLMGDGEEVISEEEFGYYIDGVFGEGNNVTIHYNSTGPAASTTPTTPTAATFADVPADAWYATPVAWALEKGITNGTGNNKFSPEKTCNTAEILTFLWRACGTPKAGAAGSFTDVASGAWYADAAQWAKSKAMVSGSTLSPDTPCTRASAVMFIWQACGKPAASKTADFTDVSANAAYAAAVAWAVEKGVTNGTGTNKFSPDDICTRGHIVTFLQRAFA